MHICNLFRPGHTVFSVEVFPPKTPEGMERLQSRLRQSMRYRPDYISVTYGAGGGTRHTTQELSGFIRRNLPSEVMAHLTCVSHSRGEIRDVVAGLRGEGIENIMALRGDPPKGETEFRPPPDGFRYATELVESIVANYDEEVCLGVAGYPEGHVEAASYADDLRHLKEKVDAGGKFIVTQFFLQNAPYYRWIEDVRRMGITVPVEPGVIAAQSLKQITKFAGFCGVEVPEALRKPLEKYEDDPESSLKVGVEYAQKQVEELLDHGVQGIHLYALNKLEPIEAIGPMIKGRHLAAAK